ncbi:MAG: PBECR4 domain-containing protein [Lachnospiraceae bacterium]|nr:PBECR4 domain-containing protein [Lachnospiraceae bacterium]MDD6182965.1 PBECR4 domain-containing protein [Lachnospiraceae bacterium]MDD7379590.1 PBECR4 domain-containing protein [Lachnospiraceae bacterium]MDY4617868.1 PBECR4 domain-containing protein [Lachnospiraceae bacterium]
MYTISFKERVKNEAITNAKLYETNFINFEYLICSKAFENYYHIIKSDKGNYLHLIGIHTNLTAEDFFDKCYNGKLEEVDFDFIKPNKSEKSVKGSVREKITVLPYMVRLFEQKLFAEDNFKRNKVECAFATSDNKCTLGFAVSGRPKSLLKGNKLETNKVKEVDLIFRKPRGSKMPYSELVYGNVADIIQYKEKILDFVSQDFLV